MNYWRQECESLRWIIRTLTCAHEILFTWQQYQSWHRRNFEVISDKFNTKRISTVDIMYINLSKTVTYDYLHIFLIILIIWTEIFGDRNHTFFSGNYCFVSLYSLQFIVPHFHNFTRVREDRLMVPSCQCVCVCVSSPNNIFRIKRPIFINLHSTFITY